MRSSKWRYIQISPTLTKNNCDGCSENEIDMTQARYNYIK